MIDDYQNRLNQAAQRPLTYKDGIIEGLQRAYTLVDMNTRKLINTDPRNDIRPTRANLLRALTRKIKEQQ